MSASSDDNLFLCSFEQFCINYCNEKLQQLFIELVLRQEQTVYQDEGLAWVKVEYFDNLEICKMIDAPKDVRRFRSSCILEYCFKCVSMVISH